MAQEYAIVLLFFGAGVVFSILGILASKIFSTSNPNQEKLKSYESGEEPFKDARVQYNPGYFIIALIFLIFEVELLFLFPWALVFDDAQVIDKMGSDWGILALIEMFIFVGLLFIGLVFVWKKGYLNWPGRKKIEKRKTSLVPEKLYQEFNQKY